MALEFPTSAVAAGAAVPPGGDSEQSMEQAIASFDWTRTPLGPMERWPQSLKTVVRLMLDSRYAMWMAWGPELTFFCNDAYRPTLGVKRDWALGAPRDQVWAEIWPDIGPAHRACAASRRGHVGRGPAAVPRAQRLPEETYHTFSYSPVYDDAGRVEGMLCVVTEETERVIGERRLARAARLSGAPVRRKRVGRRVLTARSTRWRANATTCRSRFVYLIDDEARECARRARGSRVSRSRRLPATLRARPRG